ncbi:hypothetical protein LS684_06630 [Cytobacillus spongiae]|uniref:hypothetical protein n=1 Tax=Cytobacillus spongiae TaxID=2901381 RepID=UPI001F161A4F|nr:hypothetical protein [Cytobacillus spongiae]UII57111.1 hypothetical protein LS684_06630 [Cytobacillus spongiae]
MNQHFELFPTRENRVFVGRPGFRRPFFGFPFLGGFVGGLATGAIIRPRPPYYYYPPYPYPYYPYGGYGY